MIMYLVNISIYYINHNELVLDGLLLITQSSGTLFSDLVKLVHLVTYLNCSIK